jgi:transposase InsO family protein
MSWRSCAGSRGERRFDQRIERSCRRSRGRCRGAPGPVCRCARQRCCAGTESWAGGAGRIRTGGRGDRRSIVASRRWSFDSHARTRAGVTGGSSANYGGLASPFRRPRCGRSSHATICRRRRSTVIHTPLQAPNANAHAERWVGSVRRECLDRLLIFSRRQLEHVLRVYTSHYNRHRPHRSLAFRPPEQADRSPTPLRAPPYPQLNRRDLLGGLIHEYEHAA